MSPNDSEYDLPVFAIDIGDTAELEADAIYLWIGARDPGRADRWYRQLAEVYEALRVFPYRNAALPNRSNVRRTLHGQYRILYRVIEPTDAGAEGVVRILRVIHGSRLSENTDEPSQPS